MNTLKTSLDNKYFYKKILKKLPDLLSKKNL